MSREIKIGLLTFVVLITMIWGYTFLKGRNLLTTSNELFTTYSDISGLSVSSPVLVNGYKIGTVTKIMLNKANVKKMDVYYLIDSDYKIPKDATANLKSLGLVDGKGIFLNFDKECEGNNCAINGDEIKGASIGLIGAMLGGEDVNKYTTELTTSLQTIIGEIGKEGQPGSLNATARQLEEITKNLVSMTAATNNLITQTSKGLKSTVDNMASLTGSLANNNDKITALLGSLDKITSDLATANVGNTVIKTNETLDASKLALNELKTTLATSNKTLSELTNVLNKANNGDGTLAMLMNDKLLYNNLEATTKNLNFLLQDLRLNPKRYAHFSVFGKKQKEFTLPEDDPVLIELPPKVNEE